jgi:hypothetical protein
MSIVGRIQGIFCGNTPQAKADRPKALGVALVLIGITMIYKSYRSYTSLQGRISALPPLPEDYLAKELQEIPNLKPFLLQIQESMKKGNSNSMRLFILDLPEGQKIEIGAYTFDSVIKEVILQSFYVTAFDQHSCSLYEKLNHAIHYIGQKNGQGVFITVMKGAPSLSSPVVSDFVFPPAQLDKLLAQIQSRSTTPVEYLFEPASAGDKALRFTTRFSTNKNLCKDAIRIDFINDQYNHPLAKPVVDKITEIVHQQRLPKPLIVHAAKMSWMQKQWIWSKLVI